MMTVNGTRVVVRREVTVNVCVLPSLPTSQPVMSMAFTSSGEDLETAVSLS